MKTRIWGVLMLLEEAVKHGKIRAIDPMHLMINTMALCVFPFVARPMFQRMFDISETEYHGLLEERKRVVTQFILDAIRPL